MKVLLDENVPRRLKRELAQHDASTVVDNDWSGIGNGGLLRLARAAGFDCFVTCDRNLQYQHEISALGVALIVVAVPDTRTPTILPLVPDILDVLASNPQPGTLSVVGTWRVEDR